MIKLKVNKQTSEEPIEFVAQGEFSADLTAETVETESREFADFLIANHNCEEIIEVELTTDTLNKMTVAGLTDKAIELKIEKPEKVKASLIEQILQVLSETNGGVE
jgi:transcriptional regulator CtsR